MGDRAFIYIKEKRANQYGGAYLHWGGSEAHEVIQKAAPLMRKGDASYALARLVAECCKTNPNDTCGVGVVFAQALPDNATDDEKLQWAKKWSDGDRGLFLIDIDTGEVDHVYGYDPKGKFTIPLGS
jgi:hypothetical protein